eukprot:CAMPEP_0172084138 /NCGR_PEP_ID=MMETSP1043-20130122/20827_1 /TAXON_ID=464988 /ORGANISM="Hemiselmis andersenii, Strain CCMP441" /LENGTH=71 /DNA_ID=CAMNT_0012745929 /DNA_START=153 /DNA_END=368 /DNA_ORIENTATION=-
MPASDSSVCMRSLLQSRLPMIKCTLSGYVVLSCSKWFTNRTSPVPLSTASPPKTNSQPSLSLSSPSAPSAQ